ncbi:MAG: type I DNA topoisomerase [Gammaproteobacteria bacterium]|nr:type I DNA topoisomerase [Gammaproteobacteria bacterium]
MSKNIVIVESPAKTRTIQKYLDSTFQILASYGHVRDLLPKSGSVKPESDFAMNYQVIEKNKKHVHTISQALKKADHLYLATDPDREGEAIAWHICEILKEEKRLNRKKISRVVFNQITKKAVQEAFLHPREISMDLVNAQQARRALDYLVGFNLSPLLWKKIRRGLSAGRVQSPALRLIVEREAEITQFKSQEYWTIEADLESHHQPFIAKLIRYEDNKVEQFTFTHTEQVTAVREKLSQLASGKLTVADIVKKERLRHPPMPFITSTLQQEGSRKLGLTARQTMRSAQSLYEGIDIGEGLITYMRTDSVVLAEEALQEIRSYIGAQYGDKNLPHEPRKYKTTAKNAQEAHEAIRPTSILRTPEMLQGKLPRDEWKLYDLIWKRTVASQMISAVFDVVTVELEIDASNRWRAQGRTLVVPGYLSLYQEGQDDLKKGEEEEKAPLPVLAIGQTVLLHEIRGEQHFTEPPPRYTEASLVKTLEEYGIGRPSTYASILSTLIQREYARLDKKRFIPTDVGIVVNQFLTQFFPRYVDYHFTAELEDELDAIARGEKTWQPVLKAFWDDFKPLVNKIETTVSKKEVTSQLLDEACPKCGKPLSLRLGRLGRFIGCTGYPDCTYTRNLGEDESTEKVTPEVIAGRTCPKCEGALQIKMGRYGKFIGCSQYPKCKYIEPLVKPEDLGIPCPVCREGTFLKRKSRYGKLFYSCSRYPDCKYALWNEPLKEPCPQCEWPNLTLKITKRRGKEKVCPKEGCGFIAPYEEGEARE